MIHATLKRQSPMGRLAYDLVHNPEEQKGIILRRGNLGFYYIQNIKLLHKMKFAWAGRLAKKKRRRLYG